MTTIAYDSKLGIVAADSQEVSGCDKYNCQKLFRSRGHVIATAGGSYAGMIFVRWFESWNEDGEPDWDDHPDLINLDWEEDFECLVIGPDKTCYMVNRLFVPNDATGDRFVTLGSGGSAARGALFAGATPVEAVEIAKRIDTYTGGEVKYEKIA